MTNYHRPSAQVPSATATDAELIDWFLNRLRLSSITAPGTPSDTPQDTRDIRGLSLSTDLRDFLIKFPKLVPSADEVKNPFDYWSFVEPVFTPALRSSMIPEGGHFPIPPVVAEAREASKTPQPAAYHWQWAVEDCINPGVLTEAELADVTASLPNCKSCAVALSTHPSVSEDLVRVLAGIDEVNRAAGEGLNKIRKWMKSVEKSDFSRIRNSSLIALLNYAQVLLVQLQRDQFLDSIEELHSAGGPDRVLVVVDDVEKVRAFSITESAVCDVLTERDKTLEAPQTESVHFQYPFSVRGGGGCPRLPQLGPFCHICRQAKPNLAKCTGKIAHFFDSIDSKDLRTCCHRRFCLDCLTAYNWPKPDPAVPSFKCPICAKLCTCDRCVRNVFLRSIRAFITGLTGTAIASPADPTQVDSVYAFYSLIGDYSAFAPSTAGVTPESPASDGGPTLPGARVRRQSVKPSSVVLQQPPPEVTKKPRGRPPQRGRSDGGDTSKGVNSPSPTSNLLHSTVPDNVADAIALKIEYEAILGDSGLTEDERVRQIEELLQDRDRSLLFPGDDSETDSEGHRTDGRGICMRPQPDLGQAAGDTKRPRRWQSVASSTQTLYRSQN